MKKADRITGIFTLIFSGYVIAVSSKMPQQASSFEPGVGFLPFWLGVAMAILSILLFFNSWRLPVEQSKKIFPGKKALFSIIAVMVGLAAYILLIEVLGFIVDTLFFVAFLLGGVEREKIKRVLLIAILTSGGLYLIFKVFLGVNLPKNTLGF